MKKNVLIVIAHPDTSGESFTGQLASSFQNAALLAGHQGATVNLFANTLTVQQWQDMISETHHICFAFPVWWEMPPAKLVDLLQTVFVKGFAFEQQGDRMKPLLDIQVSCLLSMGQQKDFNTTNLREAMQYCGLHPTFCLFTNVGPRLDSALAKEYLNLAARQTSNIKHLKESTCTSLPQPLNICSNS